VAFSKVEYHPHATMRLRMRHISEAQVERTVRFPDRIYASTNPPGRLIAERHTAAGNTVRVIYVERDGGTTAHVLTVYRMGGKRS